MGFLKKIKKKKEEEGDGGGGVVHYQKILESIGGFGRWQKTLVVLLWVPSMYCGMAFMTYSFALGVPGDYRCFIPACDSDESPMNASWVSAAIPTDKEGKRSNCEMYRALKEVDPENCQSAYGSAADLEEKETCDKWVYDHSVYASTVVTEFELVCHRLHMKSAIGMVGVVIFGVGSTVWGLVADTFGRKIVILVSLFFGATFNLVGSFSTSYLMYFALYVLAGLCINGTYVQPFVLTVELVDKEHAALCSQLINFPFVVGELALVVVAYFFRDFREMLRAAFLPTYLFLLIGFFVPESPRWLFVNKRTEEAKAIIRKGAKMNGVDLSEEKLDELTRPDPVTHHDGEEKDLANDSQEISVWSLLKNACMRKRLLVMYVNWIAVMLCYQALTLNSVNLGGSIYLNMALGIIIEVPSYIACILTVDRFGRKPVLLVTQFLTFAMCGVALLIQVGAPSDTNPYYVVTLATVAKFGTTTAFATVLLQVIELFPTGVRSTALGSCSLASRVGAILAPLITNLGPGYEFVPMLAFSLVSLAAGLAAFLLPETAGRELPVTVAEAEEADDSPTVAECLRCGMRC